MERTMTARKSVALVAALLLAVSTLAAFQAESVDLTAVWTGTLTRNTGDSGPAYLTLKQKGAELTGSAGPAADRQTEIALGKVATVKGVTSVTFETTLPSGAVMKFDLKLVEGRLKGAVTMERDGERVEGTLDVGREKK
jgi:hypothetical protein